MSGEAENAFNIMVGERIRARRKSLDMTQEQLSGAVGFKDRQILSNIESGRRKVSSTELMSFMGLLQESLEYFTDPYVFVQKEAFSWRAEKEANFESFIPAASSLIAAYQRFCNLLGYCFDPITPTLSLTKSSSYKDAWQAGEMVAKKLNLGDVPSIKLREALEKNLGYLVLFVDAPDNISGGACFLSDFSTIFINRNESEARRHFDLAHELFHLMTWHVVKPAEIDSRSSQGKRRPHIERLADNFAAGLLMPESSLDEFRDGNMDDIKERIEKAAIRLHVSAVALFWRLHNLGWIPSKECEKLKQQVPSWNAVRTTTSPVPKKYSTVFVEHLYEVLDRGFIGVRKASSLLNCTINDLKSLFVEYDMEVPFAL